MDLKKIITLFLAIVMCVNLLASAFPTVAYASGGEKQIEASDMSEPDASDDVIMEISGDAKYAGQAQEEIQPVSYTHLDVYKRQQNYCRRALHWKLWNKCFWLRICLFYS